MNDFNKLVVEIESTITEEELKESADWCDEYVTFIKSVCPCCGERKVALRRRRNTKYVDDSKNYLYSCLECFQDDSDYWSGKWEEYRGEQGVF